MKATNVEKFESLNKLFYLTISGTDDHLKNDKITDADIDQLVGALSLLLKEYQGILEDEKVVAI